MYNSSGEIFFFLQPVSFWRARGSFAGDSRIPLHKYSSVCFCCIWCNVTASSRNDNDDIQHICYHGRICFRFSFLYTYIFIYKSLSLSLWSINLFCPLVFNLAKDFYYFFITGLLRGNMYVSVSLSLSCLIYSHLFLFCWPLLCYQIVALIFCSRVLLSTSQNTLWYSSHHMHRLYFTLSVSNTVVRKSFGFFL